MALCNGKIEFNQSYNYVLYRTKFRIFLQTNELQTNKTKKNNWNKT